MDKLLKEEKKVLLVVPPVTTTKNSANFNLNFPIGLAYIAAVLEKASYKVIVLDAVAENISQTIPVKNNTDLVQLGMTFKEISKYIAECKPDYVGITSMFSTQAQNAHHTARVVKAINKKIPVIFGGAHATSEPEKVLNDTNVDAVILGEGENIIVPLLKAIERKEDLNSLENIAFRNRAGAIISKSNSNYVDVDKIPYPARHLFPMEKYFISGQRHGIKKASGIKYRSMPILTSRGCPFNCNFCSARQLFGKKYRPRSAQDVLKEIDDMVKAYKVEDIYLSDDQFLLNKNRILEILNGVISKNYQITLDAPNGISPWLLDEEIIKKMKEAGFWRIPLAIESGNVTVLNKMINKPIQIDKLPKLVSLLRKYKLEVEAFVVVGNFSKDEVETISQMRDTFELMRELKIRKPIVSYISPHPGSSIYQIAIRRKYIEENHFDDYYDKPTISTEAWSKDELQIFVTVQRILCAIGDNILFLPLKMLLKEYNGFYLMGRYKLIYKLYLFSNLVEGLYRKIFYK